MARSTDKKLSMTTQTVTVRLKQQVSGLGNAGEVHRVSFGYARNFLLRNGLASIIGERSAEKVIATQQKRANAHVNEHKAVMEIAQSLDGRAVTISAPGNVDGKLFASIQADDVAAALDTDPIFRMEPLKLTGIHTVTLDFGHDIVSSVTVTLRSSSTASGRRSK